MVALSGLPAHVAPAPRGPLAAPDKRHALLYVADQTGNTVTLYDLSLREAPAVQQITNGLNGPEQLYVDGAANLYVGNGTSANIGVYPFGASSPS